jgi:peptidoglycan/xylan/chitin deacetylase (PgdA/CDA1 family)
MRVDRTLTLLVAGTLRRNGKPGATLPILMYHSVSDDAERGTSPYYRVATSARRFAEQMDWLKELGYVGRSIEESFDRTDSNGSGGKTVVLTFDDGFRDFYTTAWPILKQRGFSASVYLATGFLDNPARRWRGKECLSWDHIRELRADGVRFGSHTVNHPKLVELGWDEVTTEIASSKKRIEEQLQEHITSFAYPYAFPRERKLFVRRLEQSLRDEGYRSCVTTVIGRGALSGSDMFLRRIPVNDADDRPLFRAKMAGAYDWVGSGQLIWRRLKRTSVATTA